MKKKLYDDSFPDLDRAFRRMDRKQIRRTQNIRLIPELRYRRGGKLSYVEWGHVIGIFQTLIYNHLSSTSNNDILDIGCGTGLLGIASEPYVRNKGSYVGIDVNESDIDYCRKQYVQWHTHEFIHLDILNATYANQQEDKLMPWPIESESKDLVTALSVWTHLKEEHSRFYFDEIYRVLRKNGKAIVTFFYLDEHYHNSIKLRTKGKGRFHRTNQLKWIFDQSSYRSENWLHPSWVKHPEDAIGVTPKGMNLMTKMFKQVEYHPGNWKEQPGLYFQDVFVFEKE